MRTDRRSLPGQGPDGPLSGIATRVVLDCKLADGSFKYRVTDGPATHGGLWPLLLVNLNAPVVRTVAVRRFNGWVMSLHRAAQDAYGYQWRVLSNVCLTRTEVDPARLARDLEAVVAETRPIPIPTQIRPPAETELIYAGP